MWWWGGGVLEQLHNIVSLHWSPEYLSKYLVVGVEDDDGDLTVAQNTQLVGFLHQAKFPLGEGHLSVPLVGYPRNVDLLPAHVGQSPCIWSPCMPESAGKTGWIRPGALRRSSPPPAPPQLCLTADWRHRHLLLRCGDTGQQGKLGFLNVHNCTLMNIWKTWYRTRGENFYFP